jgi:hypothetical protein
MLRLLRMLRSGQDRGRDYNRLYGHFRVRYKDGQISEPMCYDVARGYKGIFGGEVIDR